MKKILIGTILLLSLSCAQNLYQYNAKKDCQEYEPFCLAGYETVCSTDAKGCRRCSCEPLNKLEFR